MHQARTTRSAFRKLAATLAALTALGTLGATAVTDGVAHADGLVNHVSRSGTFISWVGSQYREEVRATLSGQTYTITNDHYDLTASAPCTRVTPRRVTCPSAGVTGVMFEGKGDDDTLVGGPGNDVILGGDGTDFLFGGSGNDTVDGGNGPDWVNGEVGNDTLDGGADSAAYTDAGDSISGGEGIDRVTYLAKTGPVFVRLGELGSPGNPGQGRGGLISANEQDSLREIENVTGSRYDDLIIGNAGPNRLYGTWGHDTIFGRSGADHLYGELGRDALYGELGDDFLYQRYATAGDPDPEVETSCGDRTDFDTVYRDPGDYVASDCERINPT